MNIKNILNEIEKADTVAFEQSGSRRDILKSFGAKVAVAALPLAVGSFFNKAHAKTSSANAIVDSLNFILELSYFEYNFYHTANNTGGLIPAGDQAGFLAIENQEKAHIAFLNTTITNLSGVPFTPHFYDATAVNPFFIPAAYDFTAHANSTYAPIFANVFTTYNAFLIAAQTFEDIPTVLGDATLLAQLMELQCCEARHAAHARYVRRLNNAPEIPAPWITNNIPTNGDPRLQFFYNGEDNVQQGGSIILTNLPGLTGTISQAAATSAFDEVVDSTTIGIWIAPFLL